MRIGAVADEAEVSPRMVRHYANQGLLTPGRDINGYRSFEQGGLLHGQVTVLVTRPDRPVWS
jgi:DNA-binding transcriptional MerR regulator